MSERGSETSYSTVAHGPEHGLERLIFFSDAVFAIAITLLVIEIHVPHLPLGSAETDYWISLINLTPQFIGFFISFFVIGTFWAAHHRTLALASHYDAKLTIPNLMLLSTIALIRTRGTAVILGAASAVAVSLVLPVLGQVALMSIPLWRLLIARVQEGKA